MNIFLIFLFLLSPFCHSIDTFESWQSIILKTNSQQIIKNVTEKCSNETNIWIESLQNLLQISKNCLFNFNCSESDEILMKENLFSIQQIDAFGKLPTPGIFEVKTIYDGSYQECNRISGEKYETNYCYLILKPGNVRRAMLDFIDFSEFFQNSNCALQPSKEPISMKLIIRLATCMPKSCSPQDLVKMFNQLNYFPFTACSAFCAKHEVKKDFSFYLFSSFFISIFVLSILISLFDFVRETKFKIARDDEKNPAFRWLLYFSIWSNAGTIFSIQKPKAGFIQSLDCIRTLSMVWVLSGHCFLYIMLGDTLRPLDTFLDELTNQLIINAVFAVDTFFLLSAIVLSYVFFKTWPKKEKMTNPLTWLLFYLHRYLRLTPPYILFIAFFTISANYIQGPFSAANMNMLSNEVENCKLYWWKNVLYVNNLLNENEMCFPHGWYLAADTQLYLLTPIFMILFYFSFVASTIFILIGCLASVCVTFVLYQIYNLPADLIGNGDNSNFFSIVYIKPWIRCPPYLIGLLVGSWLAVFGKKSIKLSWPISIILWCSSIAIAIPSLISTYEYDKGAQWNIFTRATYYNFSRIGWALSVSWIIIANHMGWGGPINNFMSHPMWQPFGRLSYCAYIVHWMVVFYFLNLADQPMHFSSSWQMFTHYAIPSITLTFLLAFFWSCFIEIPFMKLEQELIRKLIRLSDENSEKNVDGLKKNRSNTLNWVIEKDPN